jgi:hypothetical protein
MSESELSRYQDALMDLLARRGIDRGERLRVLREGEAFAPFAAYVEGFDPALVDFLAAVVHKWGRPRQGEGG